MGTPNIPPAPHIIEAMTEAVSNPANYVYAISDLDELHEAAAQWRAAVWVNKPKDAGSGCDRHPRGTEQCLYAGD